MFYQKYKVMKTTIKLSLLMLILISFTLNNTGQAYAQQADVSFQVFYDQLSPYGYWINSPEYGYVWVPDAEPDFAPYSTGGYWIMTNYGMTWVSNYRWGWAPFHYGRWGYNDFYGWYWVPGHEWGPAWVSWRSAGDYYGWAPMQPGISITISFGNPYGHNYFYWRFVRARDIDSHDVHRYCVDRRYYNRIISSSTVITNTYIDNSRHVTYVAGPLREDLQRKLGRKVHDVSINESDRPGQDLRNNQLNIYRPRITSNEIKNRHTAPATLSKVDDIKNRRKVHFVNENQNSNTYQSDNKPNKQLDKINKSSVNKTDNNRQVNSDNLNNSKNNNSREKVNKSNNSENKHININRTKINSGNNNRKENQLKSVNSSKKQEVSRKSENKKRK